jgi:hypothetical protein
MFLENISIFLSLENNFAWKHGLSYSSLFFLFRRASSTHCFKYLGHLSIFFQYIFFFMNNFCIATCLFSTIKLLRDSNKNLEHLFGGYPMGMFFIFTPSVGVKHFWVDLDRMACFCTYPQCRNSACVGGVYMILILRAWQISHKASMKLDYKVKEATYMSGSFS